MKNLIKFVLLGSLCFVPAGIVSFINRPISVAVIQEPQKNIVQPIPESYTGELPSSIGGSVFEAAKPVSEIKPIETPKASPHNNSSIAKPFNPAEKVFVCRDKEMLNGGTVKHCDWI